MHSNFSRTNHQGQTPIFAGAKVIGHVEDGVFYKKIQGSKHILKRPLALAFDVQSLEAAEVAGAMRVAITDSETRNVYRAPISLIWSRGFRFNRGHGAQIGLLLTDFTSIHHGTPSQLSLLGGSSNG